MPRGMFRVMQFAGLDLTRVGCDISRVCFDDFHDPFLSNQGSAENFSHKQVFDDFDFIEFLCNRY
jgi:hypothetical protein